MTQTSFYILVILLLALQDPAEGLSILSLLLIAQHAAVSDLAHIFRRLFEEILCLEDSDAEALFDAQGERRRARKEAQAGHVRAMGSWYNYVV